MSKSTPPSSIGYSDGRRITSVSPSGSSEASLYKHIPKVKILQRPMTAGVRPTSLPRSHEADRANSVLPIKPNPAMEAKPKTPRPPASIKATPRKRLEQKSVAKAAQPQVSDRPISFQSAMQQKQKMLMEQSAAELRRKLAEQRKRLEIQACNVIGTAFANFKSRKLARVARQLLLEESRRLRRIEEHKQKVRSRFRAAVSKMIWFLGSQYLKRPAVKIQAAWKGFRERVRNGYVGKLVIVRGNATQQLKFFEIRTNAASIIQRSWRKARLAVTVATYVTIRHDHKARAIQRAFRHHLYYVERNELQRFLEKRRWHAVMVLQRRWRQHLVYLQRHLDRFRFSNFPHHPRYNVL